MQWDCQRNLPCRPVVRIKKTSALPRRDEDSPRGSGRCLSGRLSARGARGRAKSALLGETRKSLRMGVSFAEAWRKGHLPGGPGRAGHAGLRVQRELGQRTGPPVRVGHGCVPGIARGRGSPSWLPVTACRGSSLVCLHGGAGPYRCLFFFNSSALLRCT